MANKRISLQKLFNNNKFVLVLSVVLAFIIWLAYSMYGGEEQEKVIEVPIKMDSMSVPEQFNLQQFGDYSSTNIAVTVRGKKAVVGTVSADDIVITASTINVNTAGKHTLPLNISIDSTKDFEIVTSSASSVEVYFDVYQEVTMDVTANITGDYSVPDGYELGKVTLSSNRLMAYGPSTEVSKISKILASAEIDKKLTTTTSANARVYAVDEYGNEIQNVTIDGGDNVKLTLPVYKLKELPVSIEIKNMPSGISQEDMNIKYSVSSLLIGGDESAVDKLENIVIGSVDFSQLSNTVNTFDFDVTKLSGFIVKGGVNKIRVRIDMSSYSKKTLTFKSDDIEITNASGFDASIETTDIKVIIIGNKSDIADIGTDSISASVDIEEDAKAGTNQNYAITFSVTDKSLKAWVYGSYIAVVTLS